MRKLTESFHNENISRIFLAIVLISCLVPFVDKPIHLDDPMFVWAAKHIQNSPFDYYGFNVNWNGFEMPMWQRTQNPPLVSYYIALIGSLFGWSEFVLHVAFLLPALLVVIGTFSLARKFCTSPVLAALTSICTPVFIVSSTTLMSDTVMLAFWVWAVFFWIKGIENDSFTDLMFAAVLISACCLSKYYGISLIPLLLAYSYASKRKFGSWVFPLLLPICILALYQFISYKLYGSSLLLNAVSYSTSFRSQSGSSYISRPITGIVFVGGCLLHALLLSPILFKKKYVAMVSILLVILIICFPAFAKILNLNIMGESGYNWSFIIQYSVFVFAGLLFIAISIMDFQKNRDAKSLLLLLWADGTVVFTCFVNWSVNGRSILPLVPVLGILAVRNMKEIRQSTRLTIGIFYGLALVVGLVISLSVAYADYKFAQSAKIAAEVITAAYKDHAGTLWFQGHWGFQYYMEKNGGKAIDFDNQEFSEKDIIIVPARNSATRTVNEDVATFQRPFTFPTTRLFSVVNGNFGAGFYSDVWGPLPYTIESDNLEIYKVYQVVRK